MTTNDNQQLPRTHFVANYLLTATNPITIHLIGAGGTGSHVLTGLAKINLALISLGHPGLFVTVWDDDTVSPANMGRQLFAQAELGLSKAVVLINRINRFFGTNWKARPVRFNELVVADQQKANIFITCVDTVTARLDIAGVLQSLRHLRHERDSCYYWLDFGNSRSNGQVVLATVGEVEQPKSKLYGTVAELPFVTSEYGDVLQQSETDDDTPSCSLAEALTKQDLFINPTLADMGCKLLWSMLREGKTATRGLFLNLADFRSQPLKV